MQKTNNAQVFKIDAKLAKIILNKHFYYSEFKQESEYPKLPGHIQRAIGREAEFQIKTLAQTDGFSDILTQDDMSEAKNYYNAFCEYYAHKGNLEEKKNPYNPNNLFATLMRADSKALALSSMQYNSKIADKTSRKAAKINQKIAERKEKGIQNNPQEFLGKIAAHIKAYSR